MSRSNRSSSRGSEEMGGDISGRIPKKPKSSNGTTANDTSHATSAVPAPPADTQQENGITRSSATAADEELDPMEQALKAMQAFREVTGETIQHDFINNSSINENDADKKPAASAAIPQKTKEELEAEQKKQEEEEAAAKKKRDEEEARERQRIKDGYAKRKAFQPKIATALDSLL